MNMRYHGYHAKGGYEDSTGSKQHVGDGVVGLWRRNKSQRKIAHQDIYRKFEMLLPRQHSPMDMSLLA